MPQFLLAAECIFFKQLNVSVTMETKHSQNVFLESESKAGVFCDAFYKTILIRSRQIINLMHRGVVEFSSQLFLLESSTSVLRPKMKAPSFRQISVILRVTIDDHPR